MKERLLFIFIILFSLTFLSCDDYLEMTPDEDLTIAEVFSYRPYAEAFLSNIYTALTDEAEFNLFTGSSDEMEIAYGGHPSHLINSGAWNPSNAINFWDDNYAAIRKCNIFLENVDNVPTNREEIQNWKGEAYFLRAYFYFQLIRLYGPVILLDHTITANDDFSSFTRAPIQDCVNLIIEDCNRAIPLLKSQLGAQEFGRASSIAAYALISRTTLYMASDLWNGNPDYAEYKNLNGQRLFPDYDNKRWADAAQASLKCIEEAHAANHALYRDDKKNVVENYQYIFVENNNAEWIFSKNVGMWGTASHFDNCCDPVSLGGFSIMNPTQELVDAYQMADGSTPIIGYTLINEATQEITPIINEESGYVDDGFATQAHPDGYHPSGVRNMYVGREPRFYASINFCLQRWKTTTIFLWRSGKDGRDNAGSDYCKTGYIQKKLTDPEMTITPPMRRNRARVYFRLGEIYLNYAEALNEAQGPVNDVYTYVNLIRDRAGLPGLPEGLSQQEMKERIRHERRIELAFEHHRFFDVRRWKIAPQTDNVWIHSMDIYSGSSRTDPAFYKRIGVEKRVFENKHYLWPIPQSEINKNKNNIPQNPGWMADVVTEE